MSSEQKFGLSIKALRGQNLKFLREKLLMNPDEFAKLCGVGNSTIRQWEAGRGNGLSVAGAKKVISAAQGANVDCDIHWLLQGEGSPPTIRDFESANLDESSLLNKEIQDYLAKQPNSITHYIQNDDLSPIIAAGDYIGGIKHLKSTYADCENQLCLIQMITGVLIGVLMASNEDDKYDIIAVNKEKQKDCQINENDIICIAPIKRIWKA